MDHRPERLSVQHPLFVYRRRLLHHHRALDIHLEEIPVRDGRRNSARSQATALVVAAAAAAAMCVEVAENVPATATATTVTQQPLLVDGIIIVIITRPVALAASTRRALSTATGEVLLLLVGVSTSLAVVMFIWMREEKTTIGGN